MIRHKTVKSITKPIWQNAHREQNEKKIKEIFKGII
jgi:hypothetical protein